MAITLTAGDFLGFIQGYARSGNSAGLSAFGSISAQPISGKTLDYLWTGGGSDALSFVGDQTANGTPTLTVNGVGWTVGTGTYNSGAGVTEYAITPSGGGFVNTTAYTVDISYGGGPPAGSPRSQTIIIGA